MFDLTHGSDARALWRQCPFLYILNIYIYGFEKHALFFCGKTAKKTSHSWFSFASHLTGLLSNHVPPKQDFNKLAPTGKIT